MCVLKIIQKQCGERSVVGKKKEKMFFAIVYVKGDAELN